VVRIHKDAKRRLAVVFSVFQHTIYIALATIFDFGSDIALLELAGAQIV
jgi:hypothetical protein